MRARARARPALRVLELLLAVSALLGSCYDTPLIPEGDETNNGGETDGGSSASASAGEAASSAGSENAGAPAATGGKGGTSATGGGTAPTNSAGEAAQAGQPGVPRVTWLELDGSRAPGSLEPNHELGIEGAFYAYSDSCADLSWNEATRCASGRLCDPGLEPNAWGMAIGFDFHKTGDTDDPPDTTFTWNPNDHRALGVTWRVTGTAPGLQLWVLNMASSWNGRCDVMSCEIAGPPDGTDAAPLQGELLFDRMIKDTWGSGVAYRYDPAAVHALQFKIPAIRVHAAAFDFCIEALGVVR